ncbi:MAG: peptide chain release factor N(5)-glutamine methyltransferase [Alphaproteobacteria bacterium]|nr:peptide chain release factor N(5)-glutamine methyltransferase [Alphaproteobacteria bacterium]
MPFSISETFDSVLSRLVAARIPSPRLETRLLLAEVLQLAENQPLPSGAELTQEQCRRLEDMLALRLRHCPLCKILGRKGFYKYDFIVDENVLSPRPDTEILVEAAVSLSKQKKLRTMVDFGTGSGCILLSVLGDVPEMAGTGVDISAAALNIAARNAQNLGLSDRTCFINAGWFDEDIAVRLGQKFDLMVSNPPYIPSADIAGLAEEVRAHDPLLALDGGKDGLRDYRRLAEIAPLILKPGAYILLEAGIGQARDIASVFEDKGFVLEHIRNDLNSIPRCVILHN